MTTRPRWLAAFWLLPLLLAAQVPPVIPIDKEPHHHLLLENNHAKVFAIDLAPRDAISTSRHDYDEVSIVLDGGATVSTTPGRPDILTFSKVGDVNFERGGAVHSVRNIGSTAYRALSVELLQDQNGARNLCGKQIPDTKPDCPAASTNAPGAPSADQPQFETDRVRVTLTRIRPGQQSTFGDADRDDLIVGIDEAAIPAASIPTWVMRGSAGRVLINNSSQEARVVTLAFRP